MFESGDLFHPLAWTAAEAYRFLQDIPAFEAGGVVVRVPDWWKARRPPRVTVQVRVGEDAPSRLGMDSLLDFEVGLALEGGEGAGGDPPLTPEEWRAVLDSTAGLALIRGRWVEVDKDKLRQLLEHWKEVKRAAGADGISLLEGYVSWPGPRSPGSVALARALRMAPPRRRPLRGHA